MKKTFILNILLLLFSNLIGQQEKYISIDPIVKLDYNFDSDNNLNIILVLNPSTDTSNKYSSPLALTSIRLIGNINWSGTAKINSTAIDVPFTYDGNYAYSAIVQNKDKIKIKYFERSGKNKWESIDNLKIVMGSTNVSRLFHLLPFYSKPTPDKATSPATSLQIENTGTIISANSIKLKFITSPTLKPFTLTKIQLKKGIQDFTIEGQEITKINTQTLNGILETTISIPNHIFNSESWEFQAQGELIGTGDPLTTEKSQVVLQDGIIKSLVGTIIPVHYATTDEDDKEIKINAVGKGDLGIEFTSNQLQQLLKPSIAQEGSIYTIKFHNLKSLTDEAITYWYTCDKQRISEPIQIIKRRAAVSNFAFDLSSANKTIINFKLPDWVNKSKLGVYIPARNIIITENGLTTSTVVEKGLSAFSTDISSYLNTKFSSTDTIVNAQVEIKYGENILYTSSVKFVNQKLIDEKVKELIKVSTEKKNPDKTAINSVLNDLVTIASKIGAVVENAEVIKVANDLAGKNNEEKVGKAMSTVATIGKWFKTLGPIVLPLLL